MARPSINICGKITMIAFIILNIFFLTDQAETIARRALDEYRIPNITEHDPVTNDAIDEIQKDFKCCGWTDFTDWDSTPYFVNDTDGMYPTSCNCADDTKNCTVVEGQNIYSTGCRDGVVEFFRNNLVAAGGIGVAFGLLQIVAVLMAIGLCGCIVSASKEYTTV